MATRGYEGFTATDAARHALKHARRPIPPTRIVQAGRSKFGAVKTAVDGITFASKGEARRYEYLSTQHRLGLIHDLELQPAYPLVVAGITIGKYIADFRYYKADGEMVVEDFKGMPTPVYRLKRRFVEAAYGITISEVR